MRTNTLKYNFTDKHKDYLRRTRHSVYNIAEGSIRSGKTTDNILAFAQDIKNSTDTIHLATASTQPVAKLVIGDCDGFGLEHIFRGQCVWGKYKGNECLKIKGEDTNYEPKIVLFCGGSKADSYKKFRGTTIGAWIGTEIDLHHPNTIDEALRRQIKANTKKLYWDLNPNNPHNFIYTDYIDYWQDLENKGTLLGGYNYERFNIFDNCNIPQRNLDEVLSRYKEGSVHWKRDILGERCVAEGLIYDIFAEDEERFYIPKADALKINYEKLIVGLDFGGNKSRHAICLSGIKGNKLYTLKTRCLNAHGVTPVQLYEWIERFLEDCREYGLVRYLYADSAEQTLINGLRNRVYPNVYNSIKNPINDRIRAKMIMLSSDRYRIVAEDCKDMLDFYREATYDSTKNEDVRLDNGTFNNDIGDAEEYSWEYEMHRLTRRG